LCEKKELVVKIDNSEAEKRIRNEYEDQLKTKDETIKSLLNSHKSDYEGEQRPPKGDPEDTAPIDREEKARNGNSERETFHIDWANSELDPSWIKGKSEAEVITVTEDLAKQGNLQAKAIIQKLTRKILHSDKPLSIEFTGSSKDFMKSPKPIPEFCSAEDKAKIISYNEKLRQNRVSWRPID
jgi:hypothetical protein